MFLRLRSISSRDNNKRTISIFSSDEANINAVKLNIQVQFHK